MEEVALKKNDKMSITEENLQIKKEKVHEASSSEPNKLRLIRELELHQFELEVQNDELKLAKEKAEIAEKKYTELYDFAPSGYLTLTKTGKIDDLNSSAVRLLGKERSRLIDNSFGFFVSPDTRAVYNSFLQNIFNTHEKESCELTLVRADDSFTHVLANGVTSNVKEKCLVTLVDISKRKFAEDESIKARDKAEEGDRLKSAFLANMSHEIRTPMNGIMGFTDLLKQVEYIYHFFKQEAEQKKLHLSFKNGLGSDNVFIRTDREKIYAVLTNLVKNAIKFTQAGSVELGYEVKGRFLEFYVKDTGPGISDEEREIIFERFRQGNELSTRKHEGAGLGLAISKAYVEMLGGKIWMESTIGQGSTFRFTIPYFNEIKEDETPEPAAMEEILSNKKWRILVVDDDETSQMLFNMMIKPFAGNYFQANNGREAVRICRKNPAISLVLMDINMPEMNGYEATRQIREFNKEVVIIAQTAYALPEDREKAIEAGCNNYISKPINGVALRELINQYLS